MSTEGLPHEEKSQEQGPTMERLLEELAKLERIGFSDRDIIKAAEILNTRKLRNGEAIYDAEGFISTIKNSSINNQGERYGKGDMVEYSREFPGGKVEKGTGHIREFEKDENSGKIIVWFVEEGVPSIDKLHELKHNISRTDRIDRENRKSKYE